jgi:predicted enzyme related to lactoylglutathione lyase
MDAFEMGFFAIPVEDMVAAKSFYGNVMGWEFNDRDLDFSYVFANGNMIGALETASESLKPSHTGPLLFFRADAIAKTLSRVTSSGGSVLDRQAIAGGERGYTAKILDPSKNAIGFWAPEN